MICDEFEAYDYRRVGTELHHQGVIVNHKKLRRLMREHDLQPKRGLRRAFKQGDTELNLMTREGSSKSRESRWAILKIARGSPPRDRIVSLSTHNPRRSGHARQLATKEASYEELDWEAERHACVMRCQFSCR